MKSTLLALAAALLLGNVAHAAVNVSSKKATASSTFEDPNNVYSESGKKFDEEKLAADCSRRDPGQAGATQFTLNGTARGHGVVKQGEASL